MKALSLTCLTAVLVLAACAGPMSFDQHLRQLEGKPVNDADLMLGHHADGHYKDGANIVYVWQDYKANSVFGSNVTNGGHRILGGDVVWAGIVTNSCVIRASTYDGIIKKITYEGNPGGCETIYGRKQEPLGRDTSQ